MAKKISVLVGVVLGLVFLGVAIMYWTTPAGNLPTFVPGYLFNSAVVHIKHGLAAAVLAFLSFVYAWFSSGKKAQAPSVPTTPSV